MAIRVLVENAGDCGSSLKWFTGRRVRTLDNCFKSTQHFPGTPRIVWESAGRGTESAEVGP